MALARCPDCHFSHEEAWVCHSKTQRLQREARARDMAEMRTTDTIADAEALRAQEDADVKHYDAHVAPILRCERLQALRSLCEERLDRSLRLLARREALTRKRT